MKINLSDFKKLCCLLIDHIERAEGSIEVDLSEFTSYIATLDREDIYQRNPKNLGLGDLNDDINGL